MDPHPQSGQHGLPPGALWPTTHHQLGTMSQDRDNSTGLTFLKSRPWLATEGTAQHGLAPVIRIDGTLMGTDKWEHFFSIGYWLWHFSNPADPLEEDTSYYFDTILRPWKPMTKGADRWAFGKYLEGISMKEDPVQLQ